MARVEHTYMTEVVDATWTSCAAGTRDLHAAASGSRLAPRVDVAVKNLHLLRTKLTGILPRYPDHVLLVPPPRFDDWAKHAFQAADELLTAMGAELLSLEWGAGVDPHTRWRLYDATSTGGLGRFLATEPGRTDLCAVVAAAIVTRPNADLAALDRLLTDLREATDTAGQGYLVGFRAGVSGVVGALRDRSAPGDHERRDLVASRRSSPSAAVARVTPARTAPGSRRVSR